MGDQVTVTEHIDAAPEAVYALVSDLPRMGEWSPENTGGKWMGGATAAAPGVRFRGTNREGGWRRWSTTVTIVDATPPTSLVFDVTAGPVKVARWGYHIEPAAGGGCTVTETWEDHRAGWMKAIAGPVTGVSDRKSHNEAGMRATLAALKAAAESGSG